MSDLILTRLRKKDTTREAVPTTNPTKHHYTGPKKVNPPYVPYTALSYEEVQARQQSLCYAEVEDTVYLNQVGLHKDGSLEWGGFNTERACEDPLLLHQQVTF